ncbi:MAG: hypothetical protein V2I46_12070 [Bacteroides sp.]|jgi:hypothetical protein|nr:hypothetical protein [Bacteroides sp.]
MKRNLLFLFLPLLIFSTCGKDPSTFPAKVNLNFGMVPFSAEDNLKDAPATGANDGMVYLSIDEGTLIINRIDFEGRRENANDVFFTADFDPPIIANLGEGISNQYVQFDIPQGIYERMEFIFHLGAPGHLPLVMTGEANLPQFGEKQVRFEYQYPEPISTIAQSSEGDDIVLKKDETSTASVLIDAEKLFRLVNIGLLVSAEISNPSGTEMIVINQDMNSPIFNVIANRLSQSLEVIIE